LQILPIRPAPAGFLNGGVTRFSQTAYVDFFADETLGQGFGTANAISFFQ